MMGALAHRCYRIPVAIEIYNLSLGERETEREIYMLAGRELV